MDFSEKFRRCTSVLLLSCIALYIIWRLAFTLNMQHPVFCLFFVAADFLSGLSTVGFILSTWKLDPQAPVSEDLPAGLKVDVLIPTFNESPDILRRTIYRCVHMDYPHNTYVLDDSRREEVKELAGRLGAVYITRQDNTHAKAGNLNNALKYANGEFVAVLDADFIPQRDFLIKLLVYFKDENVALAQVPQYYYNITSFQHRLRNVFNKIWHEQQSFFDLVLQGRNHWNASFWIGTNAIIRRKALDSAGGFAVDSVVEDMLTSMFMHSKKWKSVYINTPLAYGLAPSNLSHFLTQRLRWSKGAAQILRKHNPLFMKGLSLMQRILYFTSLLHFLEGFTKLAYYFLPALFLFTGISPIKISEQAILIIVSYVIINYASIYIISRGKISFINDEIYAMIRFFTYLRGNLAYFASNKVKFVVTPKDDVKRSSWLLFTGPAAVFCVNAAAVISRGFLLNYTYMMSPAFMVCMALCIYFSVVAIEALRLCFSYSGANSAVINDIAFVSVNIENAAHHEKQICLVQAWNDMNARFLSHISYDVGKIVIISMEHDKRSISGLKARIVDKSLFYSTDNRSVFEYNIEFEGIEEDKRLALIDYIFQKRIKIKYINDIRSKRAAFFPILIQHDEDTVAAGGIIGRDKVMLHYHKHVPAGTKLHLTMPFPGSYIMQVTDVWEGSGGNICLVGNVGREIPLYRKLMSKPSLVKNRQVNIPGLVIKILFFILIAKFIGDMVELRSSLSDVIAVNSRRKKVETHGVVKKYGNLQIKGVQLSSQDGDPVQLKGISSHGLQWFPFSSGKTIKNAVRFFDIDVLRVALYVEAFKNGGFWNGYISQPKYMTAKADRMIQEAIYESIYVILSWHIHSDPMLYTSEAKKFFKNAVEKWGGYPNIIFEICNEPEGAIPWRKIRRYAIGDPKDTQDGVIDIIRKYDPDKYPNIIIVGTPFWSQRVNEAVEAPITEYGNIMYALHFYASEHKADVRQHAINAMSHGLPIFVSEWGTCNYKADGPLDFESSDIWEKWMQDNTISWVNWSLCTKKEKASLLLPSSSIAGPWTDADLTLSGRYIRKLLKNRLPFSENCQ